MNAEDIPLSSSSKMAPWPEHHQEPVAPDKTDENRVGTTDTNTESAATNEVNATVTVNAETSEINANLTSQSASTNSSSENKQEEPAKLSTLNDCELRALLDEAITYKCPKDREGKSNLFKELLQEAEADETEEGRRAVANSRCLPGSNRRRHKRDSVSERLTHGGSLQNLAQPLSSEFDSSFTYLTSGCSHIYGGGRRKGKKHTGPSVSARQREGGSLPSNVNASHSLASLANLDLLFDKKGFSEERATYDWTNKEKSKSLDKPSYSGLKREEKEKEKKENKREPLCGQTESERELKEKRGGRGKQVTNEMVESDPPPPEPKPDYMVIEVGDVDVGGINEHNAAGAGGGVQRSRSDDVEDDEGTEMKIIEPRLPVQFITHASFDITQSPVDSTIEFPIREHNSKQDKSKVSVNGLEATGGLQYQTINSVKYVVGGSSSSASSQQGKALMPNLYSVMPWPTPSNITMETVSRLATHHIPVKESSSTGEKKSLDENGNAVQGYGSERKKTRRKHAQEPNVIVYNAENVEGHRNEKDIDSLINFIESKDSKLKKGKTGNSVRVKASSGAKPRARDKDTKREQLPAKLHKSNSLEEISKTKLEDLTAEKSTSSSGASSISSQHCTTNVALRRAKQRSTGDTTTDCRGDRRSWGTEEGQLIYCNDTGDDYTTRRNSMKKINPEPEPEPDFFVVTKKKKSKKQRRSSSGGRTQNLTTSGSYLQRSRGFTNDYRTPLSPELRRKSASSMPPSDKSDSSDLDSVHSLPVTSNTTNHNLTKTTTPSGGTPQASYADIARTATINISANSVMKISEIVPMMLNTACWPSVPTKTPSESDKIPQDYYPSLDELQHSDRKTRQHNFANSNHVNSLSLSFEKPPSPILSKVKCPLDNKKADAHEEAINKNIQVFKYVRDIEKMHQRLAQESKNTNANNSSTNSMDTIEVNQTPLKSNNFTMNNHSPESEPISPQEGANSKDSNLNSRINIPRPRRAYQQNTQINDDTKDSKKNANQHHNDTNHKNGNGQGQVSNEEKDAKRTCNSLGTNTGQCDDADNTRVRSPNNTKVSSQCNSDGETPKGVTKFGGNSKSTKDQQNNSKYEAAKVANIHSQNFENLHEANEVKKSKHPIKCLKEQSQKSSETKVTNKKNSSSRPAVILLGETSGDVVRNSDSPSELTFGFEINEQLLLSEDSESTQTVSPVYSPAAPPLFDKPPPNFDRPPPIFDKHLRYDKPPPNFHMHPTHIQHHQIHHVMVPQLPYLTYGPPPRFIPPPTYLPPPPPPGILDKYHHHPKEDFSARYVAPEESVNVQNYNHDKIVTFVGLAWDDVMREMPVTAPNGRVQYYSGQ